MGTRTLSSNSLDGPSRTETRGLDFSASDQSPDRYSYSGDAPFLTRQQIIQFAGIALASIGLFMPAVSAPIIGSMSLMTVPFSGDVILAILGLAAATVALEWNIPSRLLAGVSAVVVLVYGISAWLRLESGKQAMMSNLADNPFAGLVTGLAESVALSYGWVPALVGCLIAALLPTKKAYPVREDVSHI